MSKAIVKQLSEACSTGNLDALLQAIYYNPNISQELICGPGNDADQSDDLPTDFLHLACENGHLEVVRQLVDFGADVNRLSHDDLTPLSAACIKGHEGVAKFLVSKGAFVHSPGLGDSSPILLACSSGKFKVVEFLLSEKPGLLQSHGQLLLSEACRLGHVSIVKLLLRKGVDVNPAFVCEVRDFDQEAHAYQDISPLYAACLGRQIDVVNFLMENGAEVTEDIIEKFWELIGDALMSYTNETRNKRASSLSYEVDPSVTMFSAAWGRKNLHAVHKAWLINLSARLVCIDLSGNQIGELPDELLNILPALEMLDVSNNQLEYLPEVSSPFIRLQKLLASENHLTFVPASIFQVKSLKKLSLAHNSIATLSGDPDDVQEPPLEGETWSCTALKVLNLSHNALQHLPRGIQGASGLVKLYVDHNQLRDFPMPWKCPLELLDLSHNHLAHFSCNVEMVWAPSLKRLNLSNNKLDAISWNICMLSGLQELDLSHNAIKRLPKVDYWVCSTLHKINLSYNKLSAKPLGDVQSGAQKRFPFFKSPSQEEAPQVKTDVEFPVELFSPTLETLLLNNNSLQMVSISVCGLMSLIELDLSNNPDLRTLPPELGNLRECWQLRLNKLTLLEIPKHVRPGENGVRPKDTLAYLRATLRKSVPYYRMKMMIVGLQGRGKTTLLAALKGQKLPANLSTVGIVIDEWQLQVSSSSRFTLQRLLQTQTDAPTVTFSTWDLAGQSVYYAAHQMFLSPNTLYLAVWNVIHGEEGVESLKTWLLNIQARAPFSEVVIVGTHLDMLPKKNRESRAVALKLSIVRKYMDVQGFPKIVGNIMVSPTTGENIQELKEMIYSKALKSKDSGENIIGRRVPQSYIDLQQAIIHEAERRRTTGEPPILLEDEVLQLAKASPQNDILDTEELTLATRFLHENGILLHYNDQLRGLNHLYFIDPTWVCSLIATIVTIRERNPFIVNGVMKKKDLELVLRDPKFPQDFIPQYLQLMERFEIALAFNNEQLLIPSMLPHQKPGIQLHQLQKLISRAKPSDEKRKSDGQEKAKKRGSSSAFSRPHEKRALSTVRRNYQMAFVPSGFWSRLITRLMVSVQRWRANEGIQEGSYSLVYWREGIGAVYEGGHFLVESYKELIPLLQSKATHEEITGIAVTVWSDQRDFAAVGFIVDQIDALISEWYPGLDDTDMYGYPLVSRLIPCPQCTLALTYRAPSMRRAVSMEFPASFDATQPLPRRPLVHNFTLRTCAATALNFSTIACPYHPDKVVSLQQLIPDLLMADLPRHLLVDESQFKFTARESQKIGGGGAGEVFLGTYRNEAVAVKTFHSTRTTGQLIDSGLGESGPAAGYRTVGGSFYRRAHQSEGSSSRRSDISPASLYEEDVGEELEKTKVVRAFWDLRQEVAVLCRLNHPCVVRLLGVSLHPLCFVLELAPHGSLASVLDELSSSREAHIKQEGAVVSKAREAILGRVLSYKISFQVASAIWYLHDCDVIYRDLKADNVLVWSLDETRPLNVKLSDYGISCFATPQGVAGEEGTPGYQAPEIRTGVGYDEKVDIFSFAIFIFELLSGCRPFRDCRNLMDIKKAIRRGVRPSLESHDLDTQLPRLELLMRSCWNQLPENRPSATWILQQMEEPAFLCQCRLMPAADEGLLEKVTAIHGFSHSGPGNPMTSASAEGSSSGNTSSFALLWSREGENRNFSMINCETGVFYAHEEKCPGHRVLCMARVANRTWLGTEGCTIEVFGRRSWRLPSTLWSYHTKAPVLALLTENASSSEPSLSDATQPQGGARVKNVYASLANGTLVVFTQGTGRTGTQIEPVFEEDDEHLKTESARWSNIEVVNLGQNGMPAKSMVLVREDKELWVGCGNKIVVVDTGTLEILDDIAVYQTRRTHVRIMVTDGARVWSADRRSTKILQWNVATRQLTHIFDCDVDDPVGSVVCQEVVQARRRRAVTDVPCDVEPSYSESMWGEGIRREGNQDVKDDDAAQATEELLEGGRVTGTTHVSMTTPDDDGNSTPAVIIPGSEARFLNEAASDTNELSSGRCRSPSEETDDSGISFRTSIRSTLTNQGDVAESTNSTSSGASPDVTEDLRRLRDEEVGVATASEDVSSVTEQARVPSEVSRSVAEQKEISDVGSTPNDQPNDQVATIVSEESRTETSIERSSSDQQLVDPDKVPEIILSPTTIEGNRKETDVDTDANSNAPEFELVDREETRQAFIEGRTKSPSTASESCKESASMLSLQSSFKPVSRTPSLMSTKKRKSQRKQPESQSLPTKPWAGRPRLRVLAGSVNKVTALLLVSGSLWIGRGVGDVITVNTNSESTEDPLGHVFAKLESDNLLGYENGQVDEIVSSGSDKVVCLRRLELARQRASPAAMRHAQSDNPPEDRFTERYQLTVWEAWGEVEFRKFQNQLDEFNCLVD